MKMSDGGKGSSPRPFSVSRETYGNNFDAIFRKKTPQERDDALNEDDAFRMIEIFNQHPSSNTK
jgi:hypothetical protein